MTAECKSVLVYAAYFGGQVEREVLEAVVDRCLRWAVNQGLFEDMDENSHTVVFTHDRIQQSIRAFVPEGHVRVKMHHRIDVRLNKKRKEISCSNPLSRAILFATVDHLNMSVNLTTDRKERSELVDINLEVARLGVKSGAFSAMHSVES